MLVTAMPLKAPAFDRMLPAIQAVSATAAVVEATFRPEGRTSIATLLPIAPPSQSLIPTPPPAHFAPSLGADTLAGRPAHLRRARPSEGNSRRPTCPRLVHLSEVCSESGARGSLSYGAGRTGSQTA